MLKRGNQCYPEIPLVTNSDKEIVIAPKTLFGLIHQIQSITTLESVGLKEQEKQNFT